MTYATSVQGEIGKKYHRLLVTGAAPSGTRSEGGVEKRIVARCDCGTERVFRLASVRAGQSKSCGCLATERVRKGVAITHGQSKTTQYGSWLNMISRCDNPRNPGYKDYGARGIKVCPRWYSFENYLGDMGVRPKGMSLDRIDNDGNYEPGNCRWATASQQCRNRRSNSVLGHDGRSLCVIEWAALTGLNRATIRDRLKRGWSVADALSRAPFYRGQQR